MLNLLVPLLIQNPAQGGESNPWLASPAADPGTLPNVSTGILAYGSGAVANGSNSIAIGTTAVITAANDAIALGSNTIASATSTIAIGKTAEASSGVEGIAIGSSAKNTGSNGIHIGTSAAPATYNNASPYGVVIGYQAQAGSGGGGSVAIGYLSVANSSSGDCNVAVGRSASATSRATTAVGWDANASATNAVAIGTSAKAPGTRSISIGTTVGGSSYTICIGDACSGTNASSSVVIGRSASASSTNDGVAIGYLAATAGGSGDYMTCIGARAQLSSARYGVAIGYGARGGVGYESAFAGGEIASNRSIIHASIPQSYATTTNATSKFMLQSTGAGTVTSGLESNSMATFKGRVLSRQTAGSAGTVGDWRVWDIEFIVENVAGTHAILGTPVITLVDGAAGAAWTVDSIDAIAGGYRINITGEVDKTIKWHSCVYGQRLYFA